MLLFFLQLFFTTKRKKSVFFAVDAYYNVYEDYEFFAFRL